MSLCPTCQISLDDAARVCPVDGTPIGPPDPLVGRILGERYRVLAIIGEGGMGTVYRVEHVVLGKRMAVKVLRPEFSGDEDLVRRFQREAAAASRVGQENIVDVTDFGRTREGNLYFVMEELEGRSLAALLHEVGPLPFERSARILAQVCRALAAAHAHGIVHRDLKPDNVLVMRGEDGHDFVKVVDFGISKSPGEGSDRITRAGTIIGTPEYMAPEQGSAASVDHRADVYGFGILAYEVLTGTVPFQGPTAVATLVEHQTRAPEPPGQRRAGLPPALEQMILRALRKKPQDRQQSMGEVGEELSAVLAAYGLAPVFDPRRTPAPRPAPVPGRTLRFRAEERGSRGGTVALDAPERLPSPSAQLSPEVGAPAAERRRRAGARVALGVVLLAALASAAAWVSFRRAPAPPERSADLGPVASGVLQAAAVPQASVPRPADPAAAPAPPAPPAVSLDPGPLPRAEPAAPAAASPEAGPGRRAVAAASPRKGAQAVPRRPAPPPASAGKEVGDEAPADDNPYRKLDDLKPDPF
jgi:eukaryotic-like serine/threonine-protein kinase